MYFLFFFDVTSFVKRRDFYFLTLLRRYYATSWTYLFIYYQSPQFGLKKV